MLCFPETLRYPIDSPHKGGIINMIPLPTSNHANAPLCGIGIYWAVNHTIENKYDDGSGIDLSRIREHDRIYAFEGYVTNINAHDSN